MQKLVKLTSRNSGAVCEVHLFGSKGLSNAVKKLNWKIKNGKIYDSKNKPVVCSICRKNLITRNLSAFFAGSLSCVCDDPACFVSALYESKEK